MAEILLSRALLGSPITLKTGERHLLRISFAVRRVRLVGMFFELNKCFLLPAAMAGIRGIKQQYDAHPNSNLLLVGHTDTSGDEPFNAELSLERADATAAFLTDAVARWEAFFSDAKPQLERWGTREVQHMLSVLPEPGAPFFQGSVDGKDGPITQAAVRRFQETEGLRVDGVAGPITRRALIQRYMATDGTSLPAGIEITTHGCGESFPVASSSDGQRSPDDRRTEMFFFDGPIEPPPQGKISNRDSTDYPQWLARVTETIDFSTEDPAAEAICHLSFELHFARDDAPVAQQPFTIDVAGQIVSGTTDGAGNLDGGDVVEGDYPATIAGVAIALAAIPRSESRRRLRLSADVVEA